MNRPAVRSLVAKSRRAAPQDQAGLLDSKGEQRSAAIFIARIEEEQQIIQANCRPIELFEAKIRDRIKEVGREGKTEQQQS